jgi:starch synthase (maltosyl-transferring)
MQELRNRTVIESISPEIDGGQFDIKRVVGEHVHLEADIFGDGHDVVNAWLYFKHQSEKRWKHEPFSFITNDRWEVDFEVKKEGRYEYYIESWVDYALNWQHELRRKITGGQHVNVELLDGIQYLNHIRSAKAEDKTFIADCKKLFKDPKAYDRAISHAQSDRLEKLFRQYPFKTFPTQSRHYGVWVDRKKAGFSSWYEFFPRSSGDKKDKHSNFKDAAKRLPYVKEMGFDVVYFPPIHPIGEKNRKGKNNATEAGKDDVGSPWAIGSVKGGHKTIHADLGTLNDLKDFIAKAHDHGIELALDFALQCAPDHPYVKAHPQWFKWRPDGTVQYAENPPKKYQDILPINFETGDWENLWNELLGIVRYWIEQGVKIFRVDNPHTKPFRFWRWLIAEIRETNPEIIFLSEAFTRPRIMHQLAKVGFTQSYTYFTWRTNKRQLEEYMNELVTFPSREYFRPNFWPNTPDILPVELQKPVEPAFLTRFFLAATLSSNYGMYGPVFENMLFEAYPGKEEYINSEKYEVSNHNWEIDNKLKLVIQKVNDIRKKHPALQDTFNYKSCYIENENLMAYYKADAANKDHMLFVVNFDSYNTQSGWVNVPLDLLELKEDQTFVVKDLITEAVYYWKGYWNYVELNPNALPFHCLEIIK